MATKSKKNLEKKEIISKRRYIKIAPDKVRLAAGLVKNKKLIEAIELLKFSRLFAAREVLLNLKSALAQVKDRDLSEDNLIIKIIKVDEGPKLKRRRIIHQGRATAILKRMSHLTIVLEDNSKRLKGAKNGS